MWVRFISFYTFYTFYTLFMLKCALFVLFLYLHVRLTVNFVTVHIVQLTFPLRFWTEDKNRAAQHTRQVFERENRRQGSESVLITYKIYARFWPAWFLLHSFSRWSGCLVYRKDFSETHIKYGKYKGFETIKCCVNTRDYFLKKKFLNLPICGINKYKFLNF